MLQNRQGVFSIITGGGDHFENEEVRQELREIFGEVIVINATHISGLDMITYVAICEQFDNVIPGESIPRYQPMFQMDDLGKKQVVFIKCKTGGSNDLPH